MISESRESWSRALPEAFSFYHLGSVVTCPHPVLSPTFEENKTFIGFQLDADIRAILIVAFEKGLDLSLYSEMGNILASRLATEISQEIGEDVLLSPPQMLSLGLLRKILQTPSKDSLIHRRYTHTHADTDIAVDAWILPLTSNLTEGIGHA
jgi:hypothetical protein